MWMMPLHLHVNKKSDYDYDYDECITKSKAWKNGLENRGLRVIMKKTKFMILGSGLDMLHELLEKYLALASAHPYYMELKVGHQQSPIYRGFVEMIEP